MLGSFMTQVCSVYLLLSLCFFVIFRSARLNITLYNMLFVFPLLTKMSSKLHDYIRLGLFEIIILVGYYFTTYSVVNVHTLFHLITTVKFS